MIDMTNKPQETEDKKPFKMYIFVRKDLGMGRGKIAAQVGHACWRMGAELAMDYWTAHAEDYEDLDGNPFQGYMDYLESDGEKKLVFSIAGDAFPDFEGITIYPYTEDILYKFDDEGYLYWAETVVKDTNMDKFTILAIFTNQDIDTRRYSLLQ